MGFRNGAYARVWSVNDNGNYSTANITISKKDKDSDQYKVIFKDGFVRFIGKAHEKMKTLQIGEKGASIKLTECDVENNYVADTKTMYTNYAVFDFEIPEKKESSTQTQKKQSKPAVKKAPQSAPNDFVETSMDDDELPF